MQVSPDPTRFVLLHTSHPGNVGAAARAMRVMGFTDLVLVEPRAADIAAHPDALAMASGAGAILEGVRVVATLAEALAGMTYACATAMTPRDFGPATFAPRAHFPGLAVAAQRVAFVFGSERFGMRNDDVYRCHACLSIPTDPTYGSLNLAPLVGDHLHGVASSTPGRVPAGVERVQATLAHWERVLVAIGFLDPAAPKKLMPRLNQLLNRAALSDEEVDILRGIARSIEAARQ